MVRRLYRVDWIPDTPDEQWVTWAESQREAALEATGKRAPIIETVDLPLNHKDQLALLQAEAARRPRRD